MEIYFLQQAIGYERLKSRWRPERRNRDPASFKYGTLLVEIKTSVKVKTVAGEIFKTCRFLLVFFLFEHKKIKTRSFRQFSNLKNE